MIEVREATFGDACRIGMNLRDADRAEIKASCGGVHPVTVLIESFESSLKCWSVTKSGALAFIFGVAPMVGHPTVGVPWMLATPVVDECPKAFTRTGLAFVEEMQKIFPMLTNCTDQRNTKVLRWLKWMGFELKKVIQEYGVGKLPFIQFVRYRPCASQS
jgi:hypothetical protein